MTKLLYILCGLIALPTNAFANELNRGDTAWMLVSTVLVLLMVIPGLALFYGGLVRSKNVLSILMQCFAITCMASVLWVVVGYSLAFSQGGALNAWIGGLDNFMLAKLNFSSMSGNIPESVFITFQMTFAAITPALVVGGFAERMRFSAVLCFVALWSLLVYFPICHQVWGGGWLGEQGVLDFAGGNVVHITSGVGALVTALVLGLRRGFGTENMQPHNMTMTVTGGALLWVGWFGFNAGSAVAADGSAGMAMLVTQISSAMGGLAWMFSEWVKHGKPSVLGIVTGAVAGLVAITPASGFVGPMGALLIGLSAGVLCFLSTHLIKRTFRIDDSLDVFAVHGVGGIVGTLLTAIFIGKEFGGVGHREGMTMGSQFMLQLTDALYVMTWTAIATFVILKIIGVFMRVRVDDENELRGLDLSEHEEQGYNL